MNYHPLPENFLVEELVSEHIHGVYQDAALEFIDPRILHTLDFMRNQRFKTPITVNNWHRGGVLQHRGYREPSARVGAANSQHRHGRAIDCDVDGLSADEVCDDILKHPDLYPFITCIERGVSWVHFDVRNHNSDADGIKIIWG